MILSKLRNIFQNLKKNIHFPKIYIGKFPTHAVTGDWLLFPYHPSILRCGLTSIIEINKTLNEKSIDLQYMLQEIQNTKNITEKDFLSHQNSLLNRITQETLFREDEFFCSLAKDVNNQQILWKIADELQQWIQKLEALWESDENKNSMVLQLRDIVWRIQQEHRRNLQAMEELAQQSLFTLSLSQIRIFRRLNSIFNILDRLEIRGRDSAGIVIGLNILNYSEFLKEIVTRNLNEDYENRQKLKDLVSLSIKTFENETVYRINFVYKVCNAVGKLGDNVQELRKIIRQDNIFKIALSYSQQPITYLSHTRWASNGIINIFNCHPLDNEIIFSAPQNSYNILNFQQHPYYKKNGSLFVALNGDIDNYDQLKEQIEEEDKIHISHKITTDAKIIAIAIQHKLNLGFSMEQAFRQAVTSFEGSHAIAAQSDLEPGKIFLALHGSGQAIYIGLCEDRYIIASEVYGIVEDTDSYLAMDGETPRIPGHPETQGQIFILSSHKSGLEGIQATYYDGTEIVLQPKNLRRAEITTRDIDRQHFTHFFDKEIHEARFSILNTLKGKFTLEYDKSKIEEVKKTEIKLPQTITSKIEKFLLGNDGLQKVELKTDKIIPEKIVQALLNHQIKKIFVVGQGTASIAAQAIAYRMHKTLPNLQVQGMKSSELSGFYLEPEMKDTLVIAITQSGTTTDTNRSVDMSKKRGAYTMSIVNRRNSQITTMVDGVLYTSNGRDIEMSVASTKAFYSQVTAGEILTITIAQLLKTISEREMLGRLFSLKNLPMLLEKVLAKENEIAEIAGRWGVKRQHWAIVGSGPNYIAAQEVRIKLSELCYKSIACDFVEDKKHIDLSSEPLILVCAAGMPSSVLGDIVKDVAIFRAHNSLPIVITQEDEHRFDPYATAIIRVPLADELSSLILNTMAGHIFGYHVARSIHNLSRFFASLRDKIVEKLNVLSPDLILLDPDIQSTIVQFSKEFRLRKQEGVFTSALSPYTCSDITILLAYTTGLLPIQTFFEEFGTTASATALLETLLDRLHRAVEELARPIDAIKHQAKTVTVGTSRLETIEEVGGILFESLRNAGISIQEMRSSIIARLQQLQPAISEVKGYSYYEIKNLDATGQPTLQSTIQLLKSEGIASTIPSRCQNHPTFLVGTKRAVVQKAEIYLGLGGDQRPILIIPIFSQDNLVSHEILFHINFAKKLEPCQAKAVIGSLYIDIQNIIMEGNIPWTDDLLTLVPPEYICTHSVEEIAEAILSTKTHS